MTKSIEELWLNAFLLTLICELPVYVIAGRQILKKQASIFELFVAGTAASAVTHPLLWFVWYPLISSYWLFVLSGEVLVVIIETFAVMRIAKGATFPRALAVASLANATSWLAGVLVQ